MAVLMKILLQIDYAELRLGTDACLDQSYTVF